MIRVVRAPDPALRALLAGHPRVDCSPVDAPGGAPLVFEQDGWTRRVWVGTHPFAEFGLIELADNNPWVCADEVAVPTALGTLVLVCLGPLARSGMLVESPTFQTNCEGSQADAEDALRSVGWERGMVLAQETFQEHLGVVAATAMAEIRTPDTPSDLDDLYEEAFGRSFFVRRDEQSPWDLALVRGTPEAAYRLRYSPGEETSLLTIQALADLGGKCGASQLVHAMNVMAGFEETLGTEAAASTSPL